MYDVIYYIYIDSCDQLCFVFMQPSVIIHSAAERRPDVVEKDPSKTQQLNISATQYICHAASKDPFR